ncbi:hypothetical protein [Streptomyces barkulensis]|uniref:hypothetical protein n=1 Tax=Streptomyces barkulensis TaxID=1257026 RepID=UPI000C6E45E2|nr:hypothetical protein [Streptomyces barkulensis]
MPPLPPCPPAHQAVECEDDETPARLLADGTDPGEVCCSLTLLTHAVDVEGDSALRCGRPLTVHTTAVLLAFGADPRLPDPDGRTPVELAARYDHRPALRLLQAHIDQSTGRG